MLWNARYRKYAPAIICAGCTFLMCLLYWVAIRYGYDVLQAPEQWFKDRRALYGSHAPRYPQLTYLAIDDLSIKLTAASPEEIQASPALTQMQQGWPFPRTVYAHALDRLMRAGARLVIFDLMFITPKPEDVQFKAALDKYRDRVVVGWNYVIAGGERGKTYKTLQTPTVTLIPQEGDVVDSRLGLVNVPTDEDGTVRRMQYRVQMEPFPEIYESLSARVVEKLGMAERIPKDTRPRYLRWQGVPNSTFYSESGFVSYSLWEIFVPKLWKQNFQNGEFFRDKVVMIGPKGNFLKDELVTPMGVMPGPEIHLNAINSLIHGAFIYDTLPWLDLCAIVGGGIFACLLLYREKSPGRLFTYLIGISLFYVAVGFLFYNMADRYILISYPLLCFLGGGLLGFTNEFVAEQIERRRTRATLERYVSKNLVREILDNPATFYDKVGGVRLPVTALFSDVRDFTTMTERADPTQMVTQLNEYLQEMTRLVFQYGGTLDKFVGDAVMAVWGNIRTVGTAQDAEQAVRTALAMLESLRKLNEHWQTRGLPQWVIGVGINQGEAIAGNIGSNEKMDLTVIGDAVNTASRLEGLTKKYHVPLLIGPTVAAQVKDHFYLQSVDRAAAKGKSNALDLYTVLGDKAQPLSKEWLSYLECYEEGIRLFRIKNFIEALEMFESLLPYRPDDYLAKLYIGRCKEYIAHPPEENWNGVVIITEK